MLKKIYFTIIGAAIVLMAGCSAAQGTAVTTKAAEGAVQETGAKYAPKEDSRASASPWSADYLQYVLDTHDFDLYKFNSEQDSLEKAIKGSGMEKAYLSYSTDLFGNDKFSQAFKETDWLYYGELKDEKPDGQGSIYRVLDSDEGEKDGIFYQQVYQGGLKKGRYSGFGKKFYFFPDLEELSKYERFIKSSDNPQQCVFDYFNDVTYMGYFKDSEYEGKGNRIETPSKYLFLSDRYRGGALGSADNPAYRSLDLTKANFKKGKANGQVKEYFGDYLLYDGEMEKDQKHGKGTLYYELSNRVKYKGEFFHDEMRGKGTLYSYDGKEVCSGDWKNNMCGTVNADDYQIPAVEPPDQQSDKQPQKQTQKETDSIHQSENVNPETNSFYILSDSDSRFMGEKELAALSKEELRLARNEIYARHGREFETEDLNQYFNKQSWYYGYLTADEFDDSVLNEYEKANLNLIKAEEDQKNPGTSPAHGDNDTDWRSRYRDLETKFSTYYDHLSSQEEYTQKTIEEYQQWDNLLNELYQYLNSCYSDDRFKPIKEEQRNWVKERDSAANQGADEANGEYEKDAYYSVMIGKTKERIQYLMDYYLPQG